MLKLVPKLALMLAQVLTIDIMLIVIARTNFENRINPKTPDSRRAAGQSEAKMRWTP